MSDSWIRLNPSIEDPSNPIPSAKAPSSSCEVIVKDLRKPRTSVNHSRTNRIPRSSTVRRTYSASALGMEVTVPTPGGDAVTRRLTPPAPVGDRPVTDGPNDHASAPALALDRVQDPVVPHSARPQTSEATPQLLPEFLGSDLQQRQGVEDGLLEEARKGFEILACSPGGEELSQGRVRVSSL